VEHVLNKFDGLFRPVAAGFGRERAGDGGQSQLFDAPTIDRPKRKIAIAIGNRGFSIGVEGNIYHKVRLRRRDDFDFPVVAVGLRCGFHLVKIVQRPSRRGDRDNIDRMACLIDPQRMDRQRQTRPYFRDRRQVAQLARRIAVDGGSDQRLRA